jgi:hypothetical protein
MKRSALQVTARCDRSGACAEPIWVRGGNHPKTDGPEVSSRSLPLVNVQSWSAACQSKMRGAEKRCRT